MSSTTKKLKGVFLRGNIFWFRHGTGKNRLQVSLETRDEAEAIDKARVILENPELNPCNGFLTELNGYADEQVANGTWTANSRGSKTAVLRMFGEDMGFKDLPEIKPGEIKAWHDKQKIRVPASAQSYMLTVRAFFNWAVEKKMLWKSPAAEVKLGKITKRVRVKFCTFEQRDKIIKAAEGDDELQFILFCGFYAGMRKQEIIEARPDWFDLDHDLVHIEETPTFSIKNKKYRTVPLHPDFREFLERCGKRAPFMLKPEVEKGKSRYRYDFRKSFVAHMKANGMEWVTPHVMRHTFASLLAKNGVSLFKIAKWMGDTLATTEKHYAHLALQDEDIGMLSAPSANHETKLSSKEITALQEKVKRFEAALKELVPADKLEAYWLMFDAQEDKGPESKKDEQRTA
jgi:integrase